jgi:hypothetical protein
MHNEILYTEKEAKLIYFCIGQSEGVHTPKLSNKDLPIVLQEW